MASTLVKFKKLIFSQIVGIGMLTLYLSCLIFGGMLLSFSLIFGGDSDHSVDTDHDVDFSEDADIADDVDISHEINIDHEIDSAHDTNLSHETASGSFENQGADSVKLISFRNIIFFLTFFGLTGTLFTLFDISPAISLTSSLGMGVFSWFVGHKLMKYLKGSETGKAVDTYALKGKIAKITMPVGKNKKGKILIEAGGNLFQLTAILAENNEDDILQSKQEVIVIDIKDNTAICIKNDL